jgi:hypothetical protein
VLGGQAGVVADDLADRLGAGQRRALDELADGRLVGQVRLEDQAERAAVLVHETEVRLDRRRDALLVVRGRGERHPDRGHHRLGVLLEQREVEVELAREVLVEHRLADAGPVGDVVHRGRVVALRDEDLLRRAQELAPPRRPGQPGAARAGVRRSRHEDLLRSGVARREPSRLAVAGCLGSPLILWVARTDPGAARLGG